MKCTEIKTVLASEMTPCPRWTCTPGLGMSVVPLVLFRVLMMRKHCRPQLAAKLSCFVSTIVQVPAEQYFSFSLPLYCYFWLFMFSFC